MCLSILESLNSGDNLLLFDSNRSRKFVSLINHTVFVSGFVFVPNRIDFAIWDPLVRYPFGAVCIRRNDLISNEFIMYTICTEGIDHSHTNILRLFNYVSNHISQKWAIKRNKKQLNALAWGLNVLTPIFCVFDIRRSWGKKTKEKKTKSKATWSTFSISTQTAFVIFHFPFSLLLLSFFSSIIWCR